VGDTAHAAGERLHDWKDNVADVASTTWGTVAHKASELAQELAQRAAEAAHKASEVAHGHFEDTPKTPAQKAAEAAQIARERLGEATHRAADLAQDAKSRAAEAAHRAAEAAQGVKGQAPALLHSATQGAAVKAGTVGIKAGKALHDRAARYVPDYIPEIKVVNKKDDLTTKLLWISVGVFAGVLLGVLLAPTSGRRSRALVRDKLAKAGHEAGDLGQVAKRKASDLSNRATGVAHDIKDRIHPAPDDADDAVIEARVRTALGQNSAASQLERLNLDVVDGVVTLRGPMVDEATRATLESAVRAVRGVREVKTALLVESAEEEHTFVG
jgi:osmotically-inducible protein OsmY